MGLWSFTNKLIGEVILFVVLTRSEIFNMLTEAIPSKTHCNVLVLTLAVEMGLWFVTNIFAVLTQTDIFNVLVRLSKQKCVVLVDIPLSLEMAFLYFFHTVLG